MTTSQERGQMHSIIGEQDLWNNALTLLGAPDAILINIYGGPGTGKTLFLGSIRLSPRYRLDNQAGLVGVAV